MHHANHFYGHAHILARYCGVGGERPPLVDGYIQHGWNIGDGLAPGTPYVGERPIFVWSERTRRRAWSLGRHNAVVIGAPWVYLLAMQADRATPATEPEQEREGTIWYPFHGWESQRVHGDHRRLIDRIHEVELGPVTVCLYWVEYHTPRLRRLYERSGFRVICHGQRGHWWQKTDTRFLDKQLAELRRHRRVASNRLSSAVHYGILAGCEPAVYGDPMVLDREDLTFGGQARIRRQWAPLHGTHIDVDRAREISREELGADHIASAAELKQVLGWSKITGEPS